MVLSIFGIGLDVLIAILISIASFILSLYNLSKDKPIISVEKHSAEISKDKYTVFFKFYINNTGGKPTTIKSIEFYTKKNNFMPKVTLFEIWDESVPTLSGMGIIKKSIRGINLPFNLMPNSSKKLKAQLDFTNEDIFKIEHTENEIHYFIRIICSNKIIKSLV